MDRQLQDYYESRLEMYTTPAWKTLEEKWQEQVDAINKHWHLLPPERRDKEAGVKEELLRNLALPQVDEAAYEQLKQEELDYESSD